MVWMTIVAVIGEFPWGTWALGFVLTGLLGLFLGRIAYRMNSTTASSHSKNDQFRTKTR